MEPENARKIRDKLAHPLPASRLAYRVGELSELIGVPRKTLYGQIARGEIPHTNFGAVVVIPAWYVKRQLDTAGVEAQVA